jgi:hypothetical protein
MHWDGACYFRDMAVDWKRFILILVTGTAAGLAWNAASGRGFALGRSVLVQAGDELVEAKDSSSGARSSWTPGPGTSGA